MSDDSDDENECRYGTPLEPYDEECVPSKKSAYQDVSEQYALDANGKRRFHGAFTGGFTAGYGNSVAVPEGWAPAAFKSSRSDRAEKPQFSKPEDFMDEEDRSEFGIAPRQIAPISDFGTSKRKRESLFQDGPIPGQPVLQVLLEPVHETAAMKILGSMGWRPGKGVGEKVTRKAKARSKKVYSCHIPEEFRKITDSNNPEETKIDSSDSQSSEDEIEYSEHLFEPDDLEPYSTRPKQNTFGLGYTGLSRHSVLGGTHESKMSHLVTSDKGKKVSIRGQAFGVGAMEVEDEDIYAREDMSGYDFALEPLSKTGDKKNSKEKAKAAPVTYRTVLEGFVPAVNHGYSVKVYPPPALPKDFNPSALKASRFSPIVESTSSSVPEIRDRGLGRHDLTAKQRGTLLGENSASAPLEDLKSTESNTDKSLIQKTVEEKIAAVTGRTVDFVSNQNNDRNISNQSRTVEVPNDSNNIISLSEVKAPSSVSSHSNDDASGSSAVFKPFASNPAKQLRYEKYCKMKDEGIAITIDSFQDGGERNRLAEWEKMRELSEFERACKLYKPLTGLMNERFVSATRPDEDIATLEKKDSRQYASSDKIEAARCGMFGKLTREVTKWVPDSMVCRRFNIAEPYREGLSQGKEKRKLTYSIFEYLESPVHNKKSFLKEHTGGENVDTRKRNDVKTSSETEKPSTSKDSAQVAETKAPTEEIDIKETTTVQPVKTKRLTVVDLFMQEKEKEREVSLQKSKQLEFDREITQKDTEPVKETIDNFNKIDLYKAIFLSDSEEDLELDEKKDETQNESTKEVKNPFESPPRNIQRNESPPKGIFANLNFDRLNSWQKSSTRLKDDETEKIDIKNSDPVAKNPVQQPKVRKSRFEPINEELHGPKLPEKHIFKAKDAEKIDDISMSDVNLDLQDDMFAPKLPDSINKSTEDKISSDADFYGPKLPTKHIFRPKETKTDIPKSNNNAEVSVIELESSSSSDSDDWVEVGTAKHKKSKSKKEKSKKSKKSKKKHREHKHKSKRKHKSKHDE